jgi:hypothetical protein
MVNRKKLRFATEATEALSQKATGFLADEDTLRLGWAETWPRCKSAESCLNGPLISRADA